MSVVDINLPWNYHYMTFKTVLVFTWLSIHWLELQSWKFGQILLAPWKNILRKSDYLQELKERNEREIVKWGPCVTDCQISQPQPQTQLKFSGTELGTANWMVSLQSFIELQQYLSLCSAWWTASDKKALWSQVQGTLFTLNNEA